jgi:glycosyltransferase involved in cell wall biosynthesis
MKVAFVHDWLVTYAGAERVLEQMLLCLPQADLFTLVDALPPAERGFLGERRVHTSFLQRLPGARAHHRRFLPLMPLAVEQLDLSAYDVVISSSHAVAKGVLTGPDQLHICMCYSPIRYAWDLQHQYLKESGLDSGLKSWLARWLLHKIRMWDVRTAHGVDHFVAISDFIARRIHKVYRRSSTVIFPPVDIGAFELTAEKQDFYLTASRLVPYKKIPLIIEAFNRMPDKKLVVIGGGPEEKRCRELAGPNVHFMGYQGAEVLRSQLQQAKAFVFAAEEDFGIIPVEAQACGTPVIAYGKGGALETIRGPEHDAPTGVFFDEQTASAICDAVAAFEAQQGRISPVACRSNAERFSQDRFRQQFLAFLASNQAAFFESKRPRPEEARQP